MVNSDIKNYFIQVNVKFSDVNIDIDDERAKSIAYMLSLKYPSYKSDLFIVLLLTNFTFSSQLIFKQLPEIKDVEYKGLFNESTSTLMDDNLYKLVNDIDILLSNKCTYCCQEHDILPFKKLIECDNISGLNNRIKNLIGVGLKEIIK